MDILIQVFLKDDIHNQALVVVEDNLALVFLMVDILIRVSFLLEHHLMEDAAEGFHLVLHLMDILLVIMEDTLEVLILDVLSLDIIMALHIVALIQVDVIISRMVIQDSLMVVVILVDVMVNLVSLTYLFSKFNIVYV